MGPHRKKRRRLKPLFWITTMALLSIVVVLNLTELFKNPATGVVAFQSSDKEREYEKFKNEIAKNKYTLVMFKLNNCIWCEKVQGAFQELQSKIADPELKILLVERIEAVSKRYRITSFPTFVLFKSTNALKTWVGSDKIKDVEDFLKTDWKNNIENADVGVLGADDQYELDPDDTEEELEEEEEIVNSNNKQTPVQNPVKTITSDIDQEEDGE